MRLDESMIEKRLKNLERYATTISDKGACEKIVKQRRKSNLKVKYGMTPEEHEEKARSQGNMCAICGREFGGTKALMPHVDHCHKTGKIRDLLCLKCNTAIGHINEDPEIAKSIIRYLNKWS